MFLRLCFFCCKFWDFNINPPRPLGAGVAQLARASAFQAEGRGFEPRFPLQIFSVKGSSAN